jgi:hypothetical protein
VIRAKEATKVKNKAVKIGSRNIRREARLGKPVMIQ